MLVVLDGWGVGPSHIGNAITQAQTSEFDAIELSYPFTTLQASGIAVGLPWGEAGNSEVGHLTIGTGRIVFQHLPRITLAIQDGSFFTNPAFIGACAHVRKGRARLHLMGLLSSGSVHSYIDHLYALLELAKREKIEEVYIHVFTDGRDAMPKEGKRHIENLEERFRALGVGKIASVMGRSYALDRNGNWEKTRAAYECLTGMHASRTPAAARWMEHHYSEGVTDEFIPPVAVEASGDTRIRAHDAVVFFDYREDSARQLAEAFVTEDFISFSRTRIPSLYFVTMTEYRKGLPAHIAFEPITIIQTLGEVIAERGLKQLRIAESEKYAHVTYFFNGGREKPLEGEERILIPSESAPHYDTVPEMKTLDLAEAAMQALRTNRYTFILVNFASPDMVGHTGNLTATMHAAAIVDQAIGNLVRAVRKAGAVCMITADHGNAEEKLDPYTGEVRTEHTTNPVPCYLIADEFMQKKSPETAALKKIEVGGLLTDVAPTILQLLGIKKPVEMTGKSLLSLFGFPH